MAQTPQQAATGFYQQVISVNQQLLNIYAQIVPLLAQNTDESYATLAANLPTAAPNTDGTVSGTPDGSPNTAHPITVPVGAPLNKSATALGQGVQNLADFKNFMENVAVSAGGRRGVAQNLI
jgi:hypothetical protein